MTGGYVTPDALQFMNTKFPATVMILYTVNSERYVMSLHLLFLELKFCWLRASAQNSCETVDRKYLQ